MLAPLRAAPPLPPSPPSCSASSSRAARGDVVSVTVEITRGADDAPPGPALDGRGFAARAAAVAAVAVAAALALSTDGAAAGPPFFVDPMLGTARTPAPALTTTPFECRTSPLLPEAGAPLLPRGATGTPSTAPGGRARTGPPPPPTPPPPPDEYAAMIVW